MNTTKQISFDVTRDESLIITQIAQRAIKLGDYRDFMAISMDVTACHASGCPLKLNDLLFSSDGDFCHDIGGIALHLDRETGQLKNCFFPRFGKSRNEIARDAITAAERDLGKLSDGQKRDLLLDNIPGLRGVEEARELLARVQA